MAMASEMDPVMLLEARENCLSIGLPCYQDVSKVTETADTFDFFSNLWKFRSCILVARLTHHKQIGSGEAGHNVGSGPDEAG